MSIEVIRWAVIVLGVGAGLGLFFTSLAQFDGGWWLLGTSTGLTSLFVLGLALWLYRSG